MSAIQKTPRVLRRLSVQEISSVDRGAAVGARVLLCKRDGTETTFQQENTMDAIAKLQDDIGKSTTDTIESVAAEIQARHPLMDWSAAVSKALADPRITALHRSEQVSKGFVAKAYDPAADRRRSPDPVRVDEPAAVLEKLTDAHMKANPHLTRAAAMSAMALSPQFSQAHAADKARRGIA